jgi:hypothetical protein
MRVEIEYGFKIKNIVFNFISDLYLSKIIKIKKKKFHENSFSITYYLQLPSAKTNKLLANNHST